LKTIGGKDFMREEKRKRGYKEKSLSRVIKFLRKNAIENNFVSAKDIIQSLKLTKSQVSKNLAILQEDNYLEVKMIDYKRRTDIRKKYKLNEMGLHIANIREFDSLSNEEKNILNLYDRILSNPDKKIKREFKKIIQLFHEYALSEKGRDFSEMIRNFVTKVRKFFRYEIEYNQDLNMIESI
jgi:DNA-binding HxlR family transcriptional regulator